MAKRIARAEPKRVFDPKGIWEGRRRVQVRAMVAPEQLIEAERFRQKQIVGMLSDTSLEEAKRVMGELGANPRSRKEILTNIRARGKK
jgi:hypothetical protein